MTNKFLHTHNVGTLLLKKKIGKEEDGNTWLAKKTDKVGASM
jgi:hypothetical protein